MSDGRANALPCPPLATPMHEVRANAHDSLHCSFANGVIAIRNAHALNIAEYIAR